MIKKSDGKEQREEKNPPIFVLVSWFFFSILCWTNWTSREKEESDCDWISTIKREKVRKSRRSNLSLRDDLTGNELFVFFRLDSRFYSYTSFYVNFFCIHEFLKISLSVNRQILNFKMKRREKTGKNYNYSTIFSIWDTIINWNCQ